MKRKKLEEIKYKFKRQLLDGKVDCGILPPPTSDREALAILVKYLLGEKWYTVIPISHDQANTEKVMEILDKYNSKYI